MCDYCVNGWVNTIKFFVTKEDIKKIDMTLSGEDGKSVPKPYEFGEKCFCNEGMAMGSTDYVFQKSQIGNHLKLVDSNPLLFIDDRLFYRDLLKHQTRRVKGAVLSSEQIFKLTNGKYAFTKK